MSYLLKLYVNEPFDSSTEVGLNDYFSPDGVTSTFTLSNKTNLQLGATVQDNLTQFYFYNGGYAKSGTYNFTTSINPPAGTVLVAPAIIALSAFAFDAVNIDGNANSNVQEVPFFLGNVNDIATSQFVNLPSKSGISMIFRDLVGYGALTSMCQLASATQDAAGTAMTYIASGAEMLTPVFTAFSTVCGPTSAGVTVLTLASSGDVATFQLGDYIVINKGGPHEEVTKLIGKSSNQITVTKTDFPHSDGETVYDCARKFWMKYTIPVGFTSGAARNYYNVSNRVRAVSRSRV